MKMDKAQKILDEIERIANTLGPAVEVDRGVDVHADGRSDFPLIVLRTGDEETAPSDTTPFLKWDQRWVVRPVLEIYLKDRDNAALRSEASRIWSEFREAVRDGILTADRRLLVQSELPVLKRTVEPADGRSDIIIATIEMEFVFDR